MAQDECPSCERVFESGTAGTVGKAACKLAATVNQHLREGVFITAALVPAGGVGEDSDYYGSYDLVVIVNRRHGGRIHCLGMEVFDIKDEALERLTGGEEAMTEAHEKKLEEGYDLDDATADVVLSSDVVKPVLQYARHLQMGVERRG